MQNRKTSEPVARLAFPLGAFRGFLVLSLSANFLAGCATAGEESAGEKDVFRAVRQRDLNTVKTALRENPEIVKHTNRVGETLLHKAAFENQSDVTRLLVKSGAELEARDDFGFTPLHSAVSTGATEAAKTLIELGADYKARRMFPHEEAGPSVSVLEFAAWRGNVEIVELLLKKGVPVIDADHPKLNTPLHNACRNRTWMKGRGLEGNKGNHLVIDALMKHMDDINIRNYQRLTPLHLAAQQCAVDTIKHLLQTYPKVDVNAKAPGDKTALHFAVSAPGALVVKVKSEDRVATIHALLAGGVKLLPDSKGQTPLDLARAMGDKQVIAAFEGHDK